MRRCCILLISTDFVVYCGGNGCWIGRCGGRQCTILAFLDHKRIERELLKQLSACAVCRCSQRDSSHETADIPRIPGFFLEVTLPDQIPDNLVVAEELKVNVLELEADNLIVVPLRFTDTAGTTCLHVPSLDLIAAGDAAYNGVHPRLVESSENHK
jgi:hypothetical protein